MLLLDRLRFYRRFRHGLWLRLRLRFDNGMLTFSRTRGRCCLTLGRPARRRGAIGAIPDWRDGSRFSRQRRVSHGAVQLALLLGQRIVQIALNFDTLLTLRRNRCWPCVGFAAIGGTVTSCCEVLLAAAVWSRPAAGMLADWSSDRLMLFSPEAVCWLEDDGDFSAEPIPTINSSSTRIPTPIMMYWREAGLAGAFTLARTTLYRLLFEHLLVLRIQFFFELFLFTLATGLTSARRTAFIGIKINIVKIDLRIGITLGRLTGTTSTTIVAIGFHIVFWFEIIHLTPH